MSSSGSGAFEHGEESSYLQAPSPKRVRLDPSNGHPPELLQVSEVVETVQTEDPNEIGTVTITVPSSQFEIEVNSQVEEEEPDEVPQIERSELTGPAFGLVQDPQELPGIEGASHTDEGGTLNAIGRALLQMQQGSQPPQSPVLPPGTSAPSSASQQIFLTRGSSTTESDSGSQNAPLYVMIPPASSAEILQAMGQTRPIAPKTTSMPLSLNREGAMDIDVKSREAQRKATHNEVERRRRDRINELIKMLAMIVPGCQKKDATTGTIVGYVYSKGTVLDKTVEYLKELLAQNEQLAGTAKLAEKSANALSLLQNQITVLEKENAFLRAQIIQFGIDAAASNSQPSGVNRQILNSPLAQSLLNTVAQASQVQQQPQPQQQQAAPPPPVPPTQPVAPPPAPPAAPAPQNAGVPAASSQATAQQLLISLAQSLTNSPLLTTPTPHPQQPLPILVSSSSVNSSPPHLPTSSSVAALTPVSATPTSRLQQPAPVTLQQVVPTPVPAPPPPPGLGSSPSQVAPLINTLVQTLASIASTPSPVPKPSPPVATTAQVQAPPQVTPTAGGGLSAAAAASLLNTLIMAQNVLTNTGSPAGGAGAAMGEATPPVLGLEAVSRGEQ